MSRLRYRQQRLCNGPSTFADDGGGYCSAEDYGTDAQRDPKDAAVVVLGGGFGCRLAALCRSSRFLEAAAPGEGDVEAVAGKSGSG